LSRDGDPMPLAPVRHREIRNPLNTANVSGIQAAMPRPKKTKKTRLSHQTCVRFTDEQWKLVNAYAKRMKQDLAEAIRESVLYFSQPLPRAK